MLTARRMDQEIKSKSKKKHSRDDKDDDDYREKKKHKKSKKSSKDKHKDKDKSKDKKSDKESHKSKSDEKKPELSAIEKFNMFKKQREAAKNDGGNVVDDLFKDFITSKIKQIESESDLNNKDMADVSKSKKDSLPDSMSELNKFLDDEISNISKSEKVEENKSTVKDTSTLGSLLKLDKGKVQKDVCKKPSPNSECTKAVVASVRVPDQVVVNDVGKDPIKGSLQNDLISISHRTSLTDAVLESIPLPIDITNSAGTLEPPTSINQQTSSSHIHHKSSDQHSQPVYGPFLPMQKPDKETDSVEEATSQIKKPAIGFKNFGIKLSVTSAELIQSGEIHKKGKRLEDGKLLLIL